MAYEYNSEHYFKENCYDFLLKSQGCCTKIIPNLIFNENRCNFRQR